ncbi:MAG: hypothetical protein ABIT37_02455 [Luteolibacter sp.]
MTNSIQCAFLIGIAALARALAEDGSTGSLEEVVQAAEGITPYQSKWDEYKLKFGDWSESEISVIRDSITENVDGLSAHYSLVRDSVTSEETAKCWIDRKSSLCWFGPAMFYYVIPAEKIIGMSSSQPALMTWLVEARKVREGAPLGQVCAEFTELSKAHAGVLAGAKVQKIDLRDILGFNYYADGLNSNPPPLAVTSVSLSGDMITLELKNAQHVSSVVKIDCKTFDVVSATIEGKSAPDGLHQVKAK